MALDHEIFDNLAKEALLKYGMDRKFETKLLQISENFTYLVEDRESGAREAVLRISRPGYHSLDELRSELLWLKEINDYTPLIVADPIMGKDGSFVQVLTDEKRNAAYACVMYEFLNGSQPDEEDEANIVRQFESLGEATAHLHRQVKMWNKAGRLNRFTWDCESMIGDNGRWGDWKAAEDLTPEAAGMLEKAREVIKKRLAAFGKGKERFGLIHADLRLANLLIEGDRIKVIDFDDCGFGWFMHDLASAVSFIETKPITPSLIASWIEGYSKVERLTKEDMAEIDTFVMQRRLQLLAWITSHYDSTPVKELSVGFTEGTAVLAEKYLSKFA